MNSPRTRSVVAIVACLLILAVINLSIAGKQKHLAEGRVVYLELAPVDPRSMMQGDYMALNYRVANDVLRSIPKIQDADRPWLPEYKATDGRIIATLDDRSIASFARLEGSGEISDNEIYLGYRVRNGRMKFASNAYFFQEGTADQYTDAKYGRFRVNEDGDLLLTALHDENLNELPLQSLR